MKKRDSQRSKLYKAESVLFGHVVNTRFYAEEPESVGDIYAKPKNEDESLQVIYKAEGKVTVKAVRASLQRSQAYVDKITRSRWWKSYFIPDVENRRDVRTMERLIHHDKIKVRDGRGRHNPCGSKQGWMKVPIFSRHVTTILHELAHTFQTESPPHGRQFARIFLDLVKRWMGQDAYRLLKDSYRKNHVKYSKVRR